MDRSTPARGLAPDRAALHAALRAVRDPASGQDVVTAGLIDAIEVRDGLVQVALLTDRAHATAMEPVRRAAEAALAQVAGVTNATAVLTAHRPAAPATPQAAPAASATPQAAPAASATSSAPAAPGLPRGPGAATAPGHGHGAPQSREKLLQGVRNVVAVASGKGGVGKSTLAVNLAIALAQTGLSVGMLDADIYGPSLPRMLGIARKPELRGDRMVPIEAWGMRTMSIGFLVEEETPMIWRGPMVMGALEQMMGQAEWGTLDVMIVDMPPGTGDAQLTMAQRVNLAGAVIVSTPQDIALIDARRGVRMFEKVGVPVLGLIENMSLFACPNCGHESHIFGHGGARAEAARLGVDFLGEVPLLLDIRTAGDAGAPIAAHAPDSPAGQAYRQIAAALRRKLRA